MKNAYDLNATVHLLKKHGVIKVKRPTSAYDLGAMHDWFKYGDWRRK